jgi:hypothetical protein
MGFASRNSSHQQRGSNFLKTKKPSGGRARAIILGGLVVVDSFAAATLAMNALWPVSLQQGRPQLVAVPPLQPLTRTSTVLAPVSIAMSAIREVLEKQAPHDLTGKRQNPISQLLANAVIGWTITRGPLNVGGVSGALTVTTPLNGTLEVSGVMAGGVNAIGTTVSSLIGGGVGQQVQGLAGRTLDQHAAIQGAVAIASRPTIAPNWRLAPNLTAQVNLADVALPIAGVRISVSSEVKPFLDNAVHDQTSALEARLRNDPFIETAARSEWTKLCRAIPLGAAGQGMPALWLEIRPTRAIAAQPRIDANTVTLLLGVQAETRIVPTETKPDCPFPQQLDIVSQARDGAISIGVPIDIPFTEVSRLLEAQVKGKTFPEDGSGEFAITIRQAAVAASGDRLLISLLVNVKKRGFFSFGADATVHVWGRPVLDQEHQILRFADVTLDVQSQGAFGLLGAAAQAAVPYLQKTLAEQAVIDLKPFAEDAKARMATAIGDFAGQGNGFSATATVDDLRLVGIAYDSSTLRIIADVTGKVNVAVSSLPMQ